MIVLETEGETLMPKQDHKIQDQKIGTCALVKLHVDLWRAGVVPPLSDKDRRHTHSSMTAAG